MALQKRLVQCALGAQSALGTAAVHGLNKFGVTEGSAVKADVNEQFLDTTWSTRLAEGFERLSIMPGAEFGFVATRELVGQMLFAALGADAVTGSGAPYTHVITEAEPLTYHTFFGRDNADYFIVQDCLVDQIEFSFEGVSALKGKATLKGTTVADSATPWTTTGSDERVQSGYFTMAGGAFTIDTVSAAITKGTITLKNNLKPIQPAFDVAPIDYMPGRLELEYSFTVMPNDFGEWRKVVYGSASLPETTMSGVPHYGAFHTLWNAGADTLTLDAPQVRTMVAFPEADVEGGPVELEVTGSTAIDIGGQAITWTLLNETALYH